MKRQFFQVIDANINRSQEGLRVCEEIFRFIARDRRQSKSFKNLRHRISRLAANFPAEELLSARKAESDFGKEIKLDIRSYRNATDIFRANIQRAKEAVRVIEEFSRFSDKGLSRKFQNLRFKIYALEKTGIKKLQALRNLR